MKKYLHLLNNTLIKFIMVGIVNTIIGTTVMFILFNVFHVGYWISSACNYIIGSIVSFFLNKYFTFKVKHWSVVMVVSFIVNIITCYFIAYGVARPLVNYFLLGYSNIIRDNLALFTGMCIFVGLNYLGQRLFVFKKKKESSYAEN